MYRIVWTCKETGRTGQGAVIDGRKRARAVAAQLNEDSPGFHHEVEPVREAR